MNLKVTFIFIIVAGANPRNACLMNSLVIRTASLAALATALCGRASAQERAFFITYDHQLEEPGNLEIAVNPVFGTQREAGDFLASWAEFEYGVKGWWTTEAYIDGQTTKRDSTVLTGVRWENRFRALMTEHKINPVLYVELERINEADKTLLEVVGHDLEADHAVPNGSARRVWKTEIETKLILSSNFRGWNVAGNVIAEKSLQGAPWEFGYALGVSRPLALAASPKPCSFCPENLTAGVEAYGGLGAVHALGLRDTSHYIAAVLAWNLPSGVTLRLSPTLGLNGNSHRLLLRFGVSREFSGLGRHRDGPPGG
jgi:hypothetical protein